AGLPREPGAQLGRDALYQHTVLRHGKCMLALGLAVPSRHARQSVCDVLNFDIQRRGIQQVQPATAEHALPGARLIRGHVGPLSKRYHLSRFACIPRASVRAPALDARWPIWGRFPKLWPAGYRPMEVPMSLVKILAPLTGGERDTVVLACAFAAAKPFNSHVAALFVRPDATEAVPFFGDGVSATVVQEIAEATKIAADAAIKTARASLDAAAKAAGATIVASPEPSNVVTASFREVLGSFADQ